MKTSHHLIGRLLAEHGAIARRDHPELDHALRHLLARGRLRALLPGVYVATGSPDQLAVRLAALRLWHPDVVVTGRVAAAVTFWPGIRVDTVECALPGKRAPRAGFTFVRRRIPADLIVERDGLRLTSPALTALDLAGSLGGDPIDRALRSRMTTLVELRRALELTTERSGNGRRRELLLDSRDEPWSEAERRLHRLLRSAGITGWRANRPVVLRGHTFYLDVRFARARAAIEVDGREPHSEAETFETDRCRQNLLVLDGWLVLRFTWRMLLDRPDEVMELIREALLARGVGAELQNRPPVTPLRAIHAGRRPA